MSIFLAIIGGSILLSILLGHLVIRHYESGYSKKNFIIKCIILSVFALVMWLIVYSLIFKKMYHSKLSFGDAIRALKEPFTSCKK